MVWDRFDDAHDDLLKDIRRVERDVETFQRQLKAAGIEYKPYEQPEPHNEPGPQGWYEDTERRESSLISYKQYLRVLLESGASN